MQHSGTHLCIEVHAADLNGDDGARYAGLNLSGLCSGSRSASRELLDEKIHETTHAD